ncbi:hypothetical protein HYH02_007947 [Chlamydomonas schloesseri]|uniref:BAP29/BAP31 transmembrane domain-containing protein n=1 Tax=Chlamydomonas schloesseri TaxID=2026947 RepID=A0A835WGW9_9CHLO|nr:hypothetical protein HYH02_007947 [Chlamydomonas schloesseri]|eukprot:KAG2447206.1 hypothetical protein HYH02_007947 [Chlamydomonas schloesseri]
MASSWKVVVNWLLPPPLILTILLMLPMPQVVKKGLLAFTRQFLFMKLAGQVLLVHVALVITGAAFAASSMHTYHISQTPLPDTLTPNQRTALLAKRWREERNFWIATLTFLLWGMLYRFYALAIDHVALRDRVRQLELAAVGATRGSGSVATGGRAPVSSMGGKGSVIAEPSAPPAPADLLSGSKEDKKGK